MRILEKEIDVICICNKGKPPKPCRFKLSYSDGTVRTIEVDNIVLTEKFLPGGSTYYLYHCASEVNGSIVEYELKYFVRDIKWQLYRTVNV